MDLSMEMSDKARETRNAYMREYREKHKEYFKQYNSARKHQIKEANKRYWEKRAEQTNS